MLVELRIYPPQTLTFEGQGSKDYDNLIERYQAHSRTHNGITLQPFRALQCLPENKAISTSTLTAIRLAKLLTNPRRRLKL